MSNPNSSSKRSKRSAHRGVQFTVADSLMRYAEFLGFGDVHIKVDEETGLKAIVAVHNLKLGPAIGGCRMVAYRTIDVALEDALRLAYMMSYKSAISSLPHGGGKAVLIKPKVIKDYDAYFEKFGEFVNDLGGRYITATDSGTSTKEMDIIARRTKYVTCTSNIGTDSDPSLPTALGVRRGIEAAVKFKLNRESVEGVRIAIQGAGHVGYHLAKDLMQKGAHVVMSDINSTVLQHCVDELGVSVCAPDAIYDADVDVFAPCALGAILNLDTIKRLRAKIVAGSANNQLAHHRYGDLLLERDILYAPDFLINAGGIIHVAVIYDFNDASLATAKINRIYDTAYDIFARSKSEHRSTNQIAEAMAKERLRNGIDEEPKDAANFS
jgi:leucine dehydrogenase